MTLREQFFADIDGVFLNEDEHCEVHELDGVSCRVIVDDDQLERWKANNLTGGIGLPAHALADVRYLLYLSAREYPAPVVGQVVRFDGLPLRVASVSEMEGMLQLVLGGVTDRGW